MGEIFLIFPDYKSVNIFMLKTYSYILKYVLKNVLDMHQICNI
jgi:hypothetical protein